MTILKPGNLGLMFIFSNIQVRWQFDTVLTFINSFPTMTTTATVHNFPRNRTKSPMELMAVMRSAFATIIINPFLAARQNPKP